MDRPDRLGQSVTGRPVRPLGLAGSVFCLAGIALAALTARHYLVPEQTATDPMPNPAADGAEIAEQQSDFESASNTLKQPRLVRSVAPDFIAMPPVESGSLKRVEPRPPLSEVALAAPPDIPERFRIFRPLAPAAGRVEASGYAVTIAGIVVVEPEETCARNDGGSWPCGMLARTAFRNFLRGRSIECRSPSGPLKGTISTDCVLGKQDVGNWLVAQGWAHAAADGPYAAAEETAKSGRLGVHGSGPALGQ